MVLPKIPNTESMNVSEARRQFSDVLNRVYRGRERIVVEKNGIPMGAIVSMEDLAILESQESRQETQLDALDRYQAAFSGFSDVESEIEIARELELIRQEMREERARERT